MSTTMNSRSITDYILKLEKENSELRKVRAVLGDIDSIEESRTKIEQLKKLLTEANEEKVDALNKLNDLEYKSSLYDTTSRVTSKSCTLNQGLVNRLIDLARASNDFYKSATYQKAADAVANLPHEVENGESLMHIPGIGKGIAAKVDEYLDEQDSDYEESECSDSESISSNDDESRCAFASAYPDDGGSFVSETDDEDYFISHNVGLADMLYECADKAEDNFKRNAYIEAADTIYNLSYKITNGKDAMKLRGIGQSISKKIDDYLTPSTNRVLANHFLKLGNLEEPVYKSEAYWNAGEKIRDLTFEVSCGDDVRHMKGFGPSICDKIDEYIETGRMARLDELS